nr:hypothetical protein [uncultured Campylobacter sp.]
MSPNFGSCTTTYSSKISFLSMLHYENFLGNSRILEFPRIPRLF